MFKIFSLGGTMVEYSKVGPQVPYTPPRDALYVRPCMTSCLLTSYILREQCISSIPKMSITRLFI
jgi:hypothetical protein